MIHANDPTETRHIGQDRGVISTNGELNTRFNSTEINMLDHLRRLK